MAKKKQAAKKSAAPPKINLTIPKKQPVKRPPSPLRQIDILAKERNRLNSRLYRRKQKFQEEPRKTYQDKIRKEIRKTERERDQISTKVKGLRVKVKHFDVLRDDKSKIKSRQRYIDQKLEKLYESGGIETKQFRELNNEHLKLSDKIHAINQELGIEEKSKSYTEEEKEDIFDELETDLELEQIIGGGGRRKIKEWELAPDTPHTIWEAMRELDDSLAEDRFDIYVIDGNEFESTNKVGIRFTAANFWRIQKAKKTNTPLIEIAYDLENNAISFTPLEL